jgi:2-haloacid dehalogenase
MNIVWDIGNVLIRWQPEQAVAHLFPDPTEARAWLDAVDFFDWNYQQDGGRTLVEGLAAMEAAHPGQSAPLESYLDHFAKTIRVPITENWDLMDRLTADGHRQFAITNFSAQTWPIALTLHPRLATAFEDVVVSGIERVLKPGPEIFRLLLDRNGLNAADCLFIDDSPANVDGARQVGMAAVHFTDPQALARELAGLGLRQG